MAALTANRVKADTQGGIGTVQRLLVAGHQCQNAPGGSGDTRIVDVPRGVELVSDILEALGELRRAADSFRETLAIAAQKAFEFVHRYERHESTGVESAAHVPDNIIVEGIFDADRFAWKWQMGRIDALGPSTSARPRQTIAIYHHADDAPGINVQMIDDTLSHRGPGARSISSAPLTGIPHQASDDQGITSMV
jgi:hypothetical protein